MKIGFSQIEITPRLGTLMCGQLAPYESEGVESPLYARAMCLDDGQVKAALVSCDLLMITNETANLLCERVAKIVNVPASNIIICATHTHSGPNTVNIFGQNVDTEYIDSFQSRVVEAIEKAFANSHQGDLFIARDQLEGYAFNRRFLMSDGTVEMHPFKLNPHIVRAEGPDSKELHVIHARDCKGKVLGAIVNFGCHGTVMERTNKLISADYPGKVSEFITTKLGSSAVSLFLQGPCGNIGPIDAFKASQTEVGLNAAKKMGKAIGTHALDLIDRASAKSNGPLRVLSNTIKIPRRVTPPYLVDWAKKHKDIPVKPPVLSDYGLEVYGQVPTPIISHEELFKTAFWANFYANEVMTREQLRDKQPIVPFEIKIIAQDNWALVAVPCELFIEWGDLIRENSPFEYTAVVELANGWNGYIPTKEAFQRSGGYETKEVTTSTLVPEAGDMVLEAVVKMFKILRK